MKHGRDILDAIVGTPIAGESFGGEIFDGETEAAIFPGELPADPTRGAFAARACSAGRGSRLPFRALPPAGRRDRRRRQALPLPHISLDRALEFLLGDRLA